MIAVSVDRNVWDAFAAETKKKISVAMRDAVADGAKAASEKATFAHPFKDRTYQLMESIGWKIVKSELRTTMGQIYARKLYASRVEYGSTRAYTISSKGRGADRKPMRFRVASGEWKSAYSVEHKGSKPYPFMRPALKTFERVALLSLDERLGDLGR